MVQTGDEKPYGLQGFLAKDVILRKSGWISPKAPGEPFTTNRTLEEEESLLDSTKQGGTMMYSPLASHLPDQVVNSDHERPLPHMASFQAGVLFLDISGFTALCEKFSMSSKHGTDKLTKTLNGYMGQLAQEIINYDGDIMKYAGDAILTLWPVHSILDIQPTVWEMYKCCMAIQDKFGKWETDVGVTLRVKIGVSFGDLSVCYVGGKDFRHYVTNGEAVERVNLAEKFCTSGDVVFSPSAWPHIKKLNVPFTMCSDEQHVYVHQMDVFDEEELPEVRDYRRLRTVVGSREVLSGLETSTGKESYRPGSQGAKTGDPSGSDLTVPSAPAEEVRKKSKKVQGSFMDTTTGEFFVRKTVCRRMEGAVNQALRLYIAVPVLQKMDHDQPLEYLSEMRQVSIVFINIVMEKDVKTSKWKQCKLLQDAFSVVHPTAKGLHGCMNKIFMFDKGITFLVLFGLPGYKMENDCMHALQCAYRIKQKLDQITGIDCTSIGVTTGSSFCGVVGHDHRHEYTVIGRKVNMAARLMMHYPGIVSCDKDTHYHAKLPAGDFRVLEMKQMKGLVAVGTIREYIEGLNQSSDDQREEALKIQEFKYPILGRQPMMDIFSKLFRDIQAGKDIQMVVLNGEVGIGKSRLLEAVLSMAVGSEIKVITTALTMYDRQSAYFTVKNLMMGLIGMTFVQSHQEREKLLVENFTDPFVLQHMSILNDIFGVKFNPNSKQNNMNEGAWTKTLHEMLSRMAKEMCKRYGFVIFGIDDGHLIDDESWEFLLDLSTNQKALVVMTVKTGTSKMQWCETAQSVLEDEKKTFTIELTGLADSDMAPLACQFLKVRGIDKEVERLLMEKCHGVPLWCEQILYQLYRQNCIAIVSLDLTDPKHQLLNTPDTQLTQPKTTKSVLSHSRHSPTESSADDSSDKVCTKTDKFDRLNVQVPDSVKGIILARIDSMDTTDQMVVKCASILGVSFSQHILCYALDNLHPYRLGTSLKRLMKGGVFVCEQLTRSMSMMDTISAPTACNCKESTDPDMPATGVYCQWLRFQSSSIQETAYEMFVEQTRHQLHRSAAEYYEGQAHRCTACGGGSFLFDTLSQTKDESQLPILKGRLGKRFTKILQARHYPRHQSRVHAGEVGSVLTSSQIVVDLDVNDCKCPEVLHSVYPQLVRHWKAVQDIDRTLHYLLEAGAAALSIGNVLQAMAYLKEAESIVVLLDQNDNPFTHEPLKVPLKDVVTKWDKARLQSLFGQVQFLLGNTDDSMLHSRKALKLLGNPQPATKFRMLMRISKEKRTRWLHEHFPRRYMGKVKGDKTKWLVEQVHCLVHIFQDAMTEKRQAMALMTALQQVNQAEKVYMCVHEMIVAYTSMMEYATLTNSKSMFRHYEQKARQRCEEILSSNPNLQGVITVIHVYITFLQIHLSFGRMSDAISAGIEAEELIKSLNDSDTRALLLPLMAEALFLYERLPDFMSYVTELEKAQSDDVTAKLSFHLCALTAMLNTGFQVESIKEIANFVKGDERVFKTDKASQFIARVRLSLWYTRTDNPPIAADWMVSAETLLEPDLCNDATINRALLERLEVKLIQFARATGWGISENMKELDDEILQDMETLSSIRAISRPRLLHLQAYHATIRGNPATGQRLLAQCVQAANELEMTYESRWAEHSREAWQVEEYHMPKDPWVVQATTGMRTWSATKVEERACIFYTLPLPYWCSLSKKQSIYVYDKK